MLGSCSVVQGPERFWLSIGQLPGRMAVTTFGRKGKMVFTLFYSSKRLPRLGKIITQRFGLYPKMEIFRYAYDDIHQKRQLRIGQLHDKQQLNHTIYMINNNMISDIPINIL